MSYRVLLSKSTLPKAIRKGTNIKLPFVSEKVDRAAYIVEALAHCAECHTPRNLLGALKKNNWFQGAQDPSGKGRIPSIKTKDLRWTKEEIVEYLNSGFTPDYDVVGGKMASVVENISQLSLLDELWTAQKPKNIPQALSTKVAFEDNGTTDRLMEMLENFDQRE